MAGGTPASFAFSAGRRAELPEDGAGHTVPSVGAAGVGGPERRPAIGPGIASTPLARLARRRPVRLGRLEYEILGGRRVQRCIDEHLKGDPLQIGFSLAFQ